MTNVLLIHTITTVSKQHYNPTIHFAVNTWSPTPDIAQWNCCVTKLLHRTKPKAYFSTAQIHSPTHLLVLWLMFHFISVSVMYHISTEPVQDTLNLSDTTEFACRHIYEYKSKNISYTMCRYVCGLPS